ncbi:MAG: TetR/AcrR family transcriptional regulator [Micavibrio aeruginosavorus]|uniref:TetR/AcrR family transcriptional regulator n=1 Tax=Micavibrio aeruginosavorus TaxID=349221 RepID=A0A7T5R1G7_9BACT|nr:MAG: TetR/AcrR family transcriptional regulator [Micavibrio aeruginosavorus]
MARRNDHSREELKTMILDAAWNITGDEGFSAVTARRIARAIGYTPGTIYNVFTSMDDVLIALCARVVDELSAMITLPSHYDPAARPDHNLKIMARLYRRYASDHLHHWMLLFGYNLTESTQVPEWYNEKIALLFDPLEQMISPLFAPGGERRKKIAARILWSSVHGLCFLEATRKIPFITDYADPEEMMDYMIDGFISGIGR